MTAHIQRRQLGQVAPSRSAEPAAHDVQKKALRGMSFAEGEAAVAPVQQREGQGGEADVHAAASHGLSGAGGSMPHLAAIQRSFGAHEIGSVRAHTDNKAMAGTRAMGAEAFASGNSVAFDGAPSLHTAAHEAAHIVQQRAGVSLSGGVGKAGDSYEQQADQVADKVVRGESAEGLLSQSVGAVASSGAATQQKAVQRYQKIGNARVSDNQNLVVVDGAPHNQAYADAGDIALGNAALVNSGSNVGMAAGPALNPGDVGLTANDVAPNLVQVQVSAAVPNGGQQQDIDQQNKTSIVLAHQYELMAKTVISQLVPDGTPEATLIGEMEGGDPAVKTKVTRTYSALNGNYTPTNILAKARAEQLEDKYIAVIMNKIITYQQGIRDEIGGGGLTTPKDCGQVARNFVRGNDVGYHALSPVEQQQKGYSGHYFSHVLADGGDKVSLENAVGGSKFEQLWKSANFDFMWHFEMRGAQVDANHDVGEEEMHATGQDKTNFLSGSDNAQRNLETVRRHHSGQQQAYVDEGLTESSDQTTDKRSWRELSALNPVNPQDFEREKDLLLAGLVYANKHIAEGRTGRKGRETNWRRAVQRVIDQNGENTALAQQVLTRLQAMR